MFIRSLRAYAAEALGAFTLTFAVSLSLVSSLPVPTPFIAAVVLGLFVYTVGGISGAHLNPAITIALWSARKIKDVDAVAYIAAQLLGAVASILLLSATFAVPAPHVVNAWSVFVGEMIGAFTLAFGVSSVVFGQTPRDASGLVIGGSLFVGILIALGLGANATLNPAVAMGIGSLSFLYVLGPVCGALLAVWLYKWLIGEKK